jgi:hypothetical protein
MRGTDVNPEQMEAAERFIAEHVTHGDPLPEDQPVTVKWGELVRLVAWYGALRAIGIQKGVSTVEHPNAVASLERREPTRTRLTVVREQP